MTDDGLFPDPPDDDEDPLDGRARNDQGEERVADAIRRGETTRRARARAWVREKLDRSGDDGEDGDEDDGPGLTEQVSEAGERAWDRAGPVLTSGRAKKWYVAVAAVVVAITAFWFVLSSQGAVAAVVYTMAFVGSATLFPIAINLLGAATPNGIGKLHLLLGAVAFDHHYLVQRDRGWEWCPGDRGRVYVDGEWYAVEGEENYSILGWRPFGILRFKDDETWADKRVDKKAQRITGSRDQDDSDIAPKRAGFEAVDVPPVSGHDGTWLLNLRRVFTNGVRKIGDVELIETAEEIIERDEVDDGAVSNAGPVVETIGGLVLGVMAGYGYLFIAG